MISGVSGVGVDNSSSSEEFEETSDSSASCAGDAEVKKEVKGRLCSR